MKKYLLSIALASVVASANAGIFSTTSVDASIDAVTVPNSFTFSEVGYSYTLNGGGFTINPGVVGQVSWQAAFNSPVKFKGVQYTVKGKVTSSDANEAFVEVLGALTAFNGSATIIGSGDLGDNLAGSNSNSGNFAFTVYVPFSQDVFVGQTLSSATLLRATNNANVTLGSINQTFIPVPEPATMAILGAGVVGLVSRRRRK